MQSGNRRWIIKVNKSGGFAGLNTETVVQNNGYYSFKDKKDKSEYKRPIPYPAKVYQWAMSRINIPKDKSAHDIIYYTLTIVYPENPEMNITKSINEDIPDELLV
jgi:hypothetical protein